MVFLVSVKYKHDVAELSTLVIMCRIKYNDNVK